MNQAEKAKAYKETYELLGPYINSQPIPITDERIDGIIGALITVAATLWVATTRNSRN
jgi:hypothetical protein